ncbi:glycogen debranching N-terminal domain-containing protein, partial [Solicola sp. PLA-1-18]|uniref:amylo-alpha-1,6-glucosidase n=1 Tax=Solicola sp. PLA-1-18 TaxID=3380532 RepID=UPI003B7A36BC
MPIRQPFLHDLAVVLLAPVQAWGDTAGQVREEGAHGVYRGDVRVLSRAVVTVDGAEPEPLSHVLPGSDRATFTSALRSVAAPTADPQLLLDRERVLVGDDLRETLVVRSALPTPSHVVVELDLASDLAGLEDVKSGARPALVAPDDLVWTRGGTSASLDAGDAEVTVSGAEVRLRWDVEVPADGEVRLAWGLSTSDTAPVVAAASRPLAALAHSVRTDDPALRRLAARSFGDLDGLLMATREAPDDAFLAAGAPWFFTLFGRDTLWAARMLVPVRPELAASTLRVLAARQGVRTDAETAEQPGKILHEVRAEAMVMPGENAGRGLHLPPVYYGTVDATLLWVVVLAEAWRAGMPDDEVRALLPALEAALGWLRDHSDSDGDGFVEYADESGRGLANQGWKDSGDSIRFADGSLADGPIALAEVQGYAHEAALAGADLLEAFGRPGADDWRAWAAALSERFRAAFWCEDDLGAYPALALDAHKQRVDGVASNMGH